MLKNINFYKILFFKLVIAKIAFSHLQVVDYSFAIIIPAFLAFFAYQEYLKQNTKDDINDKYKKELDNIKTTLAGISFGQGLTRRK